MLDFDEDAYLKEQEEKRRQKLKRYESSLGFLLEQTSEKGEISLSDIWKNIQENEKNAEEMQQQLLQLSEERFSDKKIGKIEVYRIEDGSTVTFDNVFSKNGVKKSIRCSNILIRIMRNEE